MAANLQKETEKKQTIANLLIICTFAL